MQKFRKDITLPGGRRMTIRADSQAELDKKIMEARIKVENGITVINSKTTFKDYAAHWLETYKKGTISDGTYKAYVKDVQMHIIPMIGNLRLADIRRSHCARILSVHAGESESKVQKIRATAYQILESAVNDDIIPKNPMHGLKMPETRSGTHRSITDAERAAILKVAETHRAGLWIKIMLYCGLRPSEALDLLWSDIDFSRGVISVSHSIGRDTTKTRAGVRRVPAPPELLDDLRAAKRSARSVHLFTQRDGVTPPDQYTGQALWRSFRRALDIEMGAVVHGRFIVVSKLAPDLTAYCLRHTFATDMQAAGVPLNVAKVLMGHSDIKMTANIYTHFTDEMEIHAEQALRAYRESHKAAISESAAKVRQG